MTLIEVEECINHRQKLLKLQKTFHFTQLPYKSFDSTTHTLLLAAQYLPFYTNYKKYKGCFQCMDKKHLNNANTLFFMELTSNLQQFNLSQRIAQGMYKGTQRIFNSTTKANEFFHNTENTFADLNKKLTKLYNDDTDYIKLNKQKIVWKKGIDPKIKERYTKALNNKEKEDTLKQDIQQISKGIENYEQSARRMLQSATGNEEDCEGNCLIGETFTREITRDINMFMDYYKGQYQNGINALKIYSENTNLDIKQDSPFFQYMKQTFKYKFGNDTIHSNFDNFVDDITTWRDDNMGEEKQFDKVSNFNELMVFLGNQIYRLPSINNTIQELNKTTSASNYTISPEIKSWFTCDRDVIYCKNKPLPLIRNTVMLIIYYAIFITILIILFRNVGNLVIIFLIALFIPILLYITYGYTPFCLPQVPVRRITLY